MDWSWIGHGFEHGLVMEEHRLVMDWSMDWSWIGHGLVVGWSMGWSWIGHGSILTVNIVKMGLPWWLTGKEFT